MQLCKIQIIFSNAPGTDTRRVAFKYQMIDIVTSASPAEVEAARAVAKEYCDALISQVVWRVFVNWLETLKLRFSQEIHFDDFFLRSFQLWVQS